MFQDTQFLRKKELLIYLLNQVPRKRPGIKDKVKISLFGALYDKVIMESLAHPFPMDLSDLRYPVLLSLPCLKPIRCDMMRYFGMLKTAYHVKDIDGLK